MPYELIEKIFANLDGRDLMACQRVTQAWYRVVETSPLLACAFYRRYHPLPSVSRSPRGIDHSYRETLGWLARFSKEGSRSAAKLQELLTQGQPRFLGQILFFTTARVLAQAKVFDDCRVCTITHPTPIEYICPSPDQRHLMADSDDDRVTINRRMQGEWQTIATLSHHRAMSPDGFSPNGDYFIVCSGGNTVQIWETFAEPWRIQTTVTHNYLRKLRMSSDGGSIILVGIDSASISRQVNGQWQKPTPLPDSEHIRIPTFHPLENILVTCHRRTTLKIWQLVDDIWQLDTTLKEPMYVRWLLFSPEGHRLFVAYLDQPIIKIYRRAGRDWESEATCQLSKTIYSLWCSPKGDHLVAHFINRKGVGFPIQIEYSFNIWRLTDNRWQELTLLNANEFRHVGFSPDGCLLTVSREEQSIITLWRDVAGQWQQQGILPCLGEVTGICFSPHGYLAVAYDKTVTLWGISAPQWQKKADLVHDNLVHRVTFSIDGQCIFIQYLESETIHIWTLKCKEGGDVA